MGVLGIREVAHPNFTVRFVDDGHKYFIDGEEVPSVTQVTKMIGGGGGLGWWGMKVGVEGILELWAKSVACFRQNEEDVYWPLTRDEGRFPTADELVAKLTQHKMTVNHVMRKAGSRGTDVHVAAERWAEFGEDPDPLAYPEEQMGYVHAFKKWVEAENPEVLGWEQIVGSKLLGYAGTLDLRCRVNGRLGIVDYKTSKGIQHPAFDYQLAGYELASWECGFDPTEFRAILRLDKEGTYEWYESPTDPTAFRDALMVWSESENVKKHLKGRK